MAYSHDMELDSLLLAQSLVDGTDFRSGPQAKSGGVTLVKPASNDIPCTW